MEYFSLFIGIIGPNSPAASNNGQTLAAQEAKRRWSWRQEWVPGMRVGLDIEEDPEGVEELAY